MLRIFSEMRINDSVPFWFLTINKGRAVKSNVFHSPQIVDKKHSDCQCANMFTRFFFDDVGAKKKATLHCVKRKKKAPYRNFAACGWRRGIRALDRAAF